MSAFKTTTCKTLKENLAHYSLLEILHHEVGNGLAVITGYTHLLQRASRASNKDGNVVQVQKHIAEPNETEPDHA